MLQAVGVSTEKLEFVVKSYNGFTRDLHAYATANPGAKLKASVEGPYGTFPDPMQYDKIVLIAGGSGASYTFGLACNLLEKMDAESTKNIVFIWSAKPEGTCGSATTSQSDYLRCCAASNETASDPLTPAISPHSLPTIKFGVL